MGVLLQVNASSLAGRGGDEVKDYATGFGVSRLADFVPDGCAFGGIKTQ